MKKCNICGETKPLEEFYKSKKYRDGRYYRCITCDKAYADARRARDPKAFAMQQRDRYLRSKYGINSEDYENLLASQGGGCAVCGTEKPSATDKNFFAVDHCHETGKVRGLLCNLCNRGIGMLGDSSDQIFKAYEYLLKSEKDTN